MRDIIQPRLENITNIEDIAQHVVASIAHAKQLRETDRAGFVVGIISSDGDHNAKQNLEILTRYTEALRAQHAFPIFCSTDVFTWAVYNRLGILDWEPVTREETFRRFWREVLAGGEITDLFLTPRWEKSKGARDEYKAAKGLGIATREVGASLLHDK